MKPKDKKAKIQCILKTKELEMNTGLEITSLFLGWLACSGCVPLRRPAIQMAVFPKLILLFIHHSCSLQILRISDWVFIIWVSFSDRLLCSGLQHSATPH